MNFPLTRKVIDRYPCDDEGWLHGASWGFTLLIFIVDDKINNAALRKTG
jgi:hypothetical protein